MIKPIELSEIPTNGSRSGRRSETSIFCGRVLNEFINADIQAAEVFGWPNGDPETRDMARKCFSAMKWKITSMELRNVKCVSRDNRIFIIKTIALETIALEVGDGNGR